MIVKRKPRDLNPVHWLVTAQRLRHVIDDLHRAQENLRLLGSVLTRGSIRSIEERCRTALKRAERMAHRLGA